MRILDVGGLKTFGLIDHGTATPAPDQAKAWQACLERRLVNFIDVSHSFRPGRQPTAGTTEQVVLGSNPTNGDKHFEHDMAPRFALSCQAAALRNGSNGSPRWNSAIDHRGFNHPYHSAELREPPKPAHESKTDSLKMNESGCSWRGPQARRRNSLSHAPLRAVRIGAAPVRGTTNTTGSTRAPKTTKAKRKTPGPAPSSSCDPFTDDYFNSTPSQNAETTTLALGGQRSGRSAKSEPTRFTKM